MACRCWLRGSLELLGKGGSRLIEGGNRVRFQTLRIGFVKLRLPCQASSLLVRTQQKKTMAGKGMNCPRGWSTHEDMSLNDPSSVCVASLGVLQVPLLSKQCHLLCYSGIGRISRQVYHVLIDLHTLDIPIYLGSGLNDLAHRQCLILLPKKRSHIWYRSFT